MYSISRSKHSKLQPVATKLRVPPTYSKKTLQSWLKYNQLKYFFHKIFIILGHVDDLMLRLENYLNNADQPKLPAINIPTLASTGPQIDRAVVIETSKVSSRGIMRKEMASVLFSRKCFL